MSSLLEKYEKSTRNCLGVENDYALCLSAYSAFWANWTYNETKAYVIATNYSLYPSDCLVSLLMTKLHHLQTLVIRHWKSMKAPKLYIDSQKENDNNNVLINLRNFKQLF